MWTCTEWTPKRCSADENQTRTCTDLKKCNTQDGKPEETQECENPTNSNSLVLILLGVAALIIVVVLAILILKNKKPNQQPVPSPPQYPQPPRPMTPPMTPPIQQRTLQERQFPPQPQQIGQYPAPQPIQQYPPLPVSNPNNQPQN